MLELKKAGAKSLHLSYNGGDTKEPGIISTSFKFTMLDDENQDGRYDILYTGNETKYKVNLIHDASHTLFWQGYLLPDLYSEPYTNGVLFVDFEATDGLGRLKGKCLPDDYYFEEKSIIQVISACLRATGLELDLFFIPAIENAVVKDYNAIYVDTETVFKDNRKKDAYTILETLVKDMICVLYQADNRWYFEGVNHRQMRVVNYKHYNSDGVFVGFVEFTRGIKEHKALVTPMVTIVPPYGSINVSQKPSLVSLPETIYQEKNDGWAVPPGTNARVLATDWLGYGGFNAYAEAYDYSVQLQPIGGRLFTDIDLDRYIRLKQKHYLQAGEHYHFGITLDLLVYDNDTTNKIAGTFVELTIGGVLIKNIQIEILENETSKTVEFDFVVQESGLFDIKIYEPFLWLEGYRRDPIYKNLIVFRKLELTKLNNTQDFLIEDVVNDEFTLVKDIDLTIGDSASGIGSVFRLDKLKTSISYVLKEVVVKYPISFNGEYYIVVDLQSANLIADNINHVYYDDEPLENLEVIYNFNKGEEMVVKTAEVIDAGEILYVRVYSLNDAFGNRDHWEQWTDAVYKIEKKRYAQVVADIYRRMHNVAHYKIDMTLNRSVKFNDILTFPYKQDQNYIITNCSWDLDSNKTTVTAIKGYYLNSVVTNPDDNISPIVDAGSDITLPIAVVNTSLLAVASDPDGFISSYLWEQVSGANTVSFSTPYNAATLVSGLTGSGDYVFRVTVTDNEGAKASDTVTVRKNVAYVVDITEDCISDVATRDLNPRDPYTNYQRRKILGVTITPPLPPGVSVTLTFRFTLFEIALNSISDYANYIATPLCEPPTELPPLLIPGNRGRDVLNPNGFAPAVGYAVVKNGALIYGAYNGVYTNPDTVEVSVLANTDLYLILSHFADVYDSPGIFGTKTNRKIELVNAVINVGAGTISDFPETIYAYNEFSPALITPSIVSYTIASTSVTLALSDLNSASPETIDIYVEYCEVVANADDDWQVHGNVARTATSYVVSGLTTGTNYKIRCKSVVSLDTFESEYSNVINISTL